MKRRQAREFALQMLFQYDFTHGDISRLIEEFWGDKKVDPAVREFAGELFRGTLGNLQAIDNAIRETTEHWVLERMAVVDKNILRSACYELIFREDIPPIVTINEAIEIAKKYSSAESASFINGILDRIARGKGKAGRL
ncbi:MAG: transcription antitermination factor NusB [Thermodesulfovibrionales bacterium]